MLLENHERALETAKSIEIATSFFKRHFLSVAVKEIFSLNKKLTTTAVYLENNLLSSGKGMKLQSLASGLFEGIEHYLYYTQQLPMRKIAIKEIVAKNTQLLAQYPIRFLYEMNENMEISVFEFLDNQGKNLYYPSFLFDYQHQEFSEKELKSILKYKTNSGCAIGVTEEEALIHGINELMERDALSTHLISHFIQKKQETINILDETTLPKHLKEIYVEVQETLGTKILLLDITKYSIFPTYYALAYKKDEILAFKGSGTSLNSDYAIERALLELLQHYSMFDDNDRKENELNERKFRISPKYHEILLGKYRRELFCKTSYICKKVAFQNLSETLQVMINYLNKHDLQVYSATLYEEENVCCKKVIIPSLDNFQMINNGLMVLPNKSEEVFN